MPVVLKTTATKNPNAEAPHGGTPQQAGTPKFLMSGDAAKQAIKEEEAKAEIAREDSNRPRRFFIGDTGYGKDFQVTFLDGDLDKNGELLLNTWAEHTIQVAGAWRNFVCLAPEYCPMCANDNKYSMVCAFTVIDHTPYTIKSGANAGKTVENQRKLFIAKRGTLGFLQKVALAKNGLRGVRLTVTRTGKKAPQVGDVFLPLEGKYDHAELVDMCGKDKDGNRLDIPFDYASVAPYFTVEELKTLGVGSASHVIGKEPKEDVSNHL